MTEALKEKTVAEINKEITDKFTELINTNQFGFVQANFGNGTVTIQRLKSRKYRIKK